MENENESKNEKESNYSIFFVTYRLSWNSIILTFVANRAFLSL